MHEGKTKNHSYYSHPYFIRGDHSRLHQMVRCKIKGTGKKRSHYDDDDDDHDSNHGSGNGAQNSRDIQYEEIHPKCRKQAKNPITTSSDEFDCPALDSDDAVSDHEDGDLLFFDGIPFHFLSPQLDVASLKDTSGPVPDIDIDPLPLMLLPPPVFPTLGSDVEMLPSEDVFETGISSHHMSAPQQYPRSVILEENHESYCSSSELGQSMSTNVGNDRPKSSDAAILGVFDHHFYDIHPPGTKARYRNTDRQTNKKAAVSLYNPNVTLMDSWTYYHQRKPHVTAK
jgi:hypothetical protein